MGGLEVCYMTRRVPFYFACLLLCVCMHGMHLYVHVCPYNVHVCVSVFGCYANSGVCCVW